MGKKEAKKSINALRFQQAIDQDLLHDNKEFIHIDNLNELENTPIPTDTQYVVSSPPQILKWISSISSSFR